MAQSKIKPIPLTSIASSALTATYQVINTSGLPGACSILRINSSSSTLVTISYDGRTDHEVVLPNQSVTFGFQDNARPNSDLALMPKGTKVYAKGTAGTGNIYLSGYYV